MRGLQYKYNHPFIHPYFYFLFCLQSDRQSVQSQHKHHNKTGLAMEARAHLSRVQILSHQSKIASKIELYIGDGPSYEQVRAA